MKHFQLAQTAIGAAHRVLGIKTDLSGLEGYRGDLHNFSRFNEDPEHEPAFLKQKSPGIWVLGNQVVRAGPHEGKPYVGNRLFNLGPRRDLSSTSKEIPIGDLELPRDAVLQHIKDALWDFYDQARLHDDHYGTLPTDLWAIAYLSAIISARWNGGDLAINHAKKNLSDKIKGSAERKVYTDFLEAYYTAWVPALKMVWADPMTDYKEPPPPPPRPPTPPLPAPIKKSGFVKRVPQKWRPGSDNEYYDKETD